MCRDHFLLVFIRVDKCNFCTEIDTSRYTYIQYRLNRLDNPDSSYALAGFWEQFDAMRVYGDRQLNIVHFLVDRISRQISIRMCCATPFIPWTAAGQELVVFCFRIRQFIPIIPGTIRPAIPEPGKGTSAVYKHSMTWGGW